MNVPEPPRPPLGIMPKELWLEERMRELSRAIYEHIREGRMGENCVERWLTELTVNMSAWKETIKNKHH